MSQRGMSIAFAIISALGVFVFLHAGDWPVGLLFIGLVAVYVADFLRGPRKRGSSSACSV
jgi:hypothetical protein